VIVTPLGERLIERARTALRQMDDLVETARRGPSPLSGPLRLGVIPTIAPYLLPRWLPAVRKAHPELALSLHEDKTDRILEQLEDGRLDLLLLALPVPGDHLESELLFEEPFVLAAPVGHRLLRRRAPAATEDLRDEAVLLLDDGHCLREQALAVCELAGAREARELRATSLVTLVQMVANGLGVTLIPATAVDALVGRQTEVAVRAFRRPAPSRKLGLVWRRTSARADEFRVLAGLLRKQAPKSATRAA
jgi:LysR family hydrogen peroxide-inducible transcriptional activator